MRQQRQQRRRPMSEINVVPYIDVMLVLLVIFMVTAPMMDLRIGMGLAQSPDRPPPPRVERELGVEPGDLFRLDGISMTPGALEHALADWRQQQPDGVLKLAVSPDADYQSAATAMAAAKRAPVDGDTLITRVAAVLKYKPKTPIMVRGDRNVDYGRVVEAMVLIQAAGAPGVGLITEIPER